MRSFPHRDERRYADIDPNEYDFYSGHIGFKTASRIGGDMITVLRNPVDRFISVYYFWRQLYANGVEQSRNTSMAAKYDLDQFVLIRDEPFLMEEFYNRITWQVAHGSSIQLRLEMRSQGRSEDDIYQTAIDNIGMFAVVGTQERMSEFGDKLRQKYGIELQIKRENVTQNKAKKRDIKIQTLRQIQDWVYMDIELYQHVLSQLG
jgi:Sulfotransferase family